MPKSQFIDPKKVRAAGTIHFEDIPVNVYNSTISQEKKIYSKADFLRIYRDMAIIREFETMLNDVKTKSNYNGVEYNNPGPAHLSIGQEASAVGQAYVLDIDDFIFGSHRSHGEILAKGLSAIHKLDENEIYDIMKELGAVWSGLNSMQKSQIGNDLFGKDNITTGASNDLEKVSNLARSMVTTYGMSEKMGNLAYGKDQEHIFMGRNFGNTRDFSEEIAADIDKEVKKIVDAQYEHAKNRGAKIYAEIVGFATNTDGTHITNPNKDMMKEVMIQAIDNTKISKEEIGYVNAHGTATIQGDVAESNATKEAFERNVPISSIKSYTGHTLGACGAIETILSIEMMNNKWFAPTLNLKNLDENCAELDYIVNEGRNIDTEYIMTNNFAFGGINTSLILKRA